MILKVQLQGFEAVVDSMKEYPLTKRDSILIRPGHSVSLHYTNKHVACEFMFLQNVVSLMATKITPNSNIEIISPEKRNCYFDYEYPLKSQQQYSYVRLKIREID